MGGGGSGGGSKNGSNGTISQLHQDHTTTGFEYESRNSTRDKFDRYATDVTAVNHSDVMATDYKEVGSDGTTNKVPLKN